MSRPVTRAELQEALARFLTPAELEKVLATDREPINAEIGVLKTDVAGLKAVVGGIEFNVAELSENGRMHLRMFQAMFERMERMERDRKADDVAMEQRLMAELARATLGSHEWLASQVRVVDDKYKDLPDRVTRLEAEVVPRERR